MKSNRDVIQPEGGLDSPLIRQNLTDKLPQYKAQDKQNPASTPPVHADWTAKDVAWTRLSTQNRMTGALSMQPAIQIPTTIERGAPVGWKSGQSTSQEPFYHYRERECVMFQKISTRRKEDGL